MTDAAYPERRQDLSSHRADTRPGQPYPLGASWDGRGVNFALFSENATHVEVCLFDSAEADVESRRLPLREQTDMVWHAYVPGLRPGQLYGYRVYERRVGQVFDGGTPYLLAAHSVAVFLLSE